MIDLNVIQTKLRNSLLFAHPTTTVLQRSENSCWIILETNAHLMSWEGMLAQFMNYSAC